MITKIEKSQFYKMDKKEMNRILEIIEEVTE